MNNTASAQRQGRQATSGGERKRTAILEAVLRIISDDGIRAVRHRAVAAEANVSLAATTYYFSSLQDLLVDSFTHWCEQTGADIEQFKVAANMSLKRAENLGLETDAGRRETIGVVCQLTADYVIEQVSSGRKNRNIELAFRHEALRDDRLSQLVRVQDHKMLASITEFNQLFGTADPKSDAEISLAVLLHLERQALMDGIDREHIETVLLRHFSNLAGL